jgi:Skp family chaperone for outer membrane proteins
MSQNNTGFKQTLNLLVQAHQNELQTLEQELNQKIKALQQELITYVNFIILTKAQHTSSFVV